MTFQEWLNNQCAKRANNEDFKAGHLMSNGHSILFDNLLLKDGISLSVQASAFHYCEPREYLDDGAYESVEVYVSGVHDTVLNNYCDDNKVAKYVPVEIMEKVAEHHGGICN
jgi:hypothetical protein